MYPANHRLRRHSLSIDSMPADGGPLRATADTFNIANHRRRQPVPPHPPNPCYGSIDHPRGLVLIHASHLIPAVKPLALSPKKLKCRAQFIDSLLMPEETALAGRNLRNWGKFTYFSDGKSPKERIRVAVFCRDFSCFFREFDRFNPILGQKFRGCTIRRLPFQRYSSQITLSLEKLNRGTPWT
jgi:hypothetical protein